MVVVGLVMVVDIVKKVGDIKNVECYLVMVKIYNSEIESMMFMI